MRSTRQAHVKGEIYSDSGGSRQGKDCRRQTFAVGFGTQGKVWPKGANALGLDCYDCWAFTPEEMAVIERGEDPAQYAPFLIPRDVARQRTEALIYEQVRRGMYENGIEVRTDQGAKILPENSSGRPIFCRTP